MKLSRIIIPAFSTYSRIPMPRVPDGEADMRFAPAVLPLVGLTVALFFYLTTLLTAGFSPLFRACAAALIPLAVTGGIHMDGFLDTCDALSSWQDREKKLAILKDVHIGAFAAIRGAMYLIALLGAYGEGLPALALPLAMGFVLSRCLSVFAMSALPNARSGGMLFHMTDGMDRKAALSSSVLFGFLSLSCALAFCPLPALLAAAALFANYIFFKRMAARHFGGITGDLAGFLVQTSELVWALALVIFWRIL